jgi:hypothetical protein
MSNTYEMSGRVKVVFAPMSFASGFTKREFVLTMEGFSTGVICGEGKGQMARAMADRGRSPVESCRPLRR